ncbi:hypothetical protein MNNICLKF_02349 [Synechococcus sp. CBW1107]|nr:hypothetical protein MNNICLKF_02349 [Synechococcus sp. CBW1107]
MAIRNGRRAPGGQPERRPYVFPSLKVDGELWAEPVSIPNRGQGLLEAQQEAAAMIRAKRAAMAPTVPASVDSEESNLPNSGASAVDVSPVLSPTPAPVAVEQTIREWLAAHLPSSEQLFAASASLVGLQGIDARVRDLVASFQEGLDSFRAGFSSWWDGVQAEWAALTAQAAETLAQWQQQMGEVAAWRDDLEQRLFAAIADKVGPKGAVGSTGMAGAATTVVDRLPKGKGADFLFPYIGRNAVLGDIAIDGSTDMRYAWRWTGQSWERGPAMTSLQVRDVKISAMDASTKVTSSMVTTRAGGSGSGGEKLRSRLAPVNTSVQLADSSNWRNTTQDPTAGQLFLEYTAADGSLQGRKGYAAISFVWEPSSDSFTEYALIGDISGGYTVQLNIQRSAAVVPGGITGSLPPGTTCTQIFGRLVPTPGSGTTTTTQFLLSGVVLWAFSAKGTSIPANQSPETPLWTWQ